MKLVTETSESEKHARDVQCILWHDNHLFSGSDDGTIKVNKIWNIYYCNSKNLVSTTVSVSTYMYTFEALKNIFPILKIRFGTKI